MSVGADDQLQSSSLRADLLEGEGSLSFGTRAAVVATASRLAVFAVAVVGAYVAYNHGDAVYGAARELFITPWTRKDAGWFVHIAREGYGQGTGRAAFFPLYPMLVRVASVLTLGSYWVAGMLVSLASYAGAMVLLFRLAALETDRRIAARTVVLISVFPTAFVFSAVYSESLFMLLTVAAFYWARRRRWVLACVAGFLATLTRSSGLILVVPLLLIFADQQGWMSRRPRLSSPDDARVAWVLLVPAGLLAYMAYLWVKFGNATLFMDVQHTYWRRALNWPWSDVWRGARAAVRGASAIYADLSLFPTGLLPGHRLEFLFARTLLPFLALMFAVFCLVLVFRRLPLPYGVYGLLALLVPLLEPSGIAPLYSFHRFVLVVFPLFMGLALTLDKRKKLFWVIAAVSFVLMLYLTACYTSETITAHGVV